MKMILVVLLTYIILFMFTTIIINKMAYQITTNPHTFKVVKNEIDFSLVSKGNLLVKAIIVSGPLKFNTLGEVTNNSSEYATGTDVLMQVKCGKNLFVTGSDPDNDTLTLNIIED